MPGAGRLTGVRMLARLAAVPVVSAALLIGFAPPALACADGTVVCSTSGGNNNGALSAGVSYITITTSGGSYPSSSGPIEVPNQVPPPCWYTKGRSGQEMVDDYSDPQLRRLAHGVGENFDDWFPDDFRDHREGRRQLVVLAVQLGPVRRVHPGVLRLRRPVERGQPEPGLGADRPGAAAASGAAGDPDGQSRTT